MLQSMASERVGHDYTTELNRTELITSWQTEGGKGEIVTDFIFLDFKTTVDCDYSHEIKECLLLGRKVMTNLNRELKSRDITLLKKVHIVVKTIFFFR